jgi:molybdopterin-guanine dinucleotide biosynthesis protein MobB
MSERIEVPQPAIINVIGLQNSGKTRLVQALVRHLKLHHLTVAVLKHDGHASRGENLPDWQKLGSDTSLALSAGADWTLLAGGGQSLVHQAHDMQAAQPEALCARLTRRALDAKTPLDVIVVEGYKNSHLPKIAVLRTPTQVAWIQGSDIQNIRAIFAADVLSEEEVHDCPAPIFRDGDVGEILRLFGVIW